MSDLTQNQINEIVYFADNNMKTLKFIPDENRFFPNFTFEYYSYIPVISLRSSAGRYFSQSCQTGFWSIFDSENFGILSWLSLILANFIKWESKVGLLFFIQKKVVIKLWLQLLNCGSRKWTMRRILTRFAKWYSSY
jgi:putative colanic acid biosynthesis UDP-glucose lipid carrier transferase